MFLDSNIVLLRNYLILQKEAIQVQKVAPEAWKLWVTKNEYAYIKKRRSNITRRLRNRITVLNTRTSLFAAA